MTSRLTITELEKVSTTVVDGATVMAPEMPPVYEQGVDIGVGSTPCDFAWTDRTRFVMLNTDVECWLAWSVEGDPDPSAQVGLHRLGPNETRFYGVKKGGKLAVIGA